MEARLTVPDAIERVPGLTDQQLSEIKTTVAVVDIAVREGARAITHESSRERAQEISRDRDRDLGYGD